MKRFGWVIVLIVLFAAWQARASVALQDLTPWAQQLPMLIGDCDRGLRRRRCCPIGLYQECRGQAILVALNDAPHPLLIPTSGKALAAKASRTL